jgi:uncharacterized SAM-binding protein YcdF (DUF218 family)
MLKFKHLSFKQSFSWLRRAFHYLIMGMGILMLMGIVLSFTDYPFWAYYWLGTHNTEMHNDPSVIVVMGGGGMPSPDGLIRCYYGSEVAAQYPLANVIIAVPEDTSMHEDSPDVLMAHELIIRGIDSTRISFENKGINTRSQALNILNLLGRSADTLSVRIVTSPEHMLRSVAAFRKVGFREVGGMPSFEEDIDEQLLLKNADNDHEETGLQRSLGLRYNMWNYMKYEIMVVREYFAIVYYKFRGWI